MGGSNRKTATNGSGAAPSDVTDNRRPVIGELNDALARLGAGFSICQRRMGVSFVDGAEAPTNMSTAFPDTNGRRGTPQDGILCLFTCFYKISEQFRTLSDSELVPLAGVEPALLAELDFESSASTNSATGARRGQDHAKRRASGADISEARGPVNPPSAFFRLIFLC
jgi:hypothetical protein